MWRNRWCRTPPSRRRGERPWNQGQGSSHPRSGDDGYRLCTCILWIMSLWRAAPGNLLPLPVPEVLEVGGRATTLLRPVRQRLARRRAVERLGAHALEATRTEVRPAPPLSWYGGESFAPANSERDLASLHFCGRPPRTSAANLWTSSHQHPQPVLLQGRRSVSSGPQNTQP